MKKLLTVLLMLIYLNVNAQTGILLKNAIPTTLTNGLKFNTSSDFIRSKIIISSELKTRVENNQKFFLKDRCDIYIKSIKDSIEVCVYLYSKDTLIINDQKMPYKNKFKP